MNASKTIVRPTLLLCIVYCLALPLVRSADAAPPIPAILQAGLKAYTIGGAGAAVAAWLKGGPLEGDKIAETQINEFKEFEKLVGHYRSFEVIETREIGKASALFYLSINFERGASFASFLVYRTPKDWIVQRMEVSKKPETIMPWLLLGGRNSQR